MLTFWFILVTVTFLAYANGANDNFKGMATWFGSGAANYRQALRWATAATFLGALAAVLVSGQLMRNFSGRELVPDEVAGQVGFAAAVASGAGLTVWLATRLGLPISTTHALLGALLGAGWAVAEVNVGRLGSLFVTPLLVSPLLASALAGLGHAILRPMRRAMGIAQGTCLCVGGQTFAAVTADGRSIHEPCTTLSASLGTVVTCRQRYVGQYLGISFHQVVIGLHRLSGGLACFARGLNDAPKIAALALTAWPVSSWGVLGLVGVAMAAGGLLSGWRVAHTMSHDITTMSLGQGLTASLATSAIVVGASVLGLPVSFTHVSCGALFGIGMINGHAHGRTILKILGAWLVTLPIGFLGGAAAVFVGRIIG